MLGIDVQAALRAKDEELLALEAELRAQIQTNERQGEEGEELSLQVHPDQPFACKCSPPRLDRRGAEPANRVAPRAPDLPLACTRSARFPSCSSSAQVESLQARLTVAEERAAEMEGAAEQARRELPGLVRQLAEMTRDHAELTRELEQARAALSAEQAKAAEAEAVAAVAVATAASAATSATAVVAAAAAADGASAITPRREGSCAERSSQTALEQIGARRLEPIAVLERRRRELPADCLSMASLIRCAPSGAHRRPRAPAP